MFTITPLYRLESAGLNPLELVLVGTFMEAAVFVFEIPTGIVADVYSRRLSIIIGNIGMGIGFVIEGAYPHVGTIMAAQIFWGITYTFTSGATEAWLAGEVGESALTGIFLRAQQLGQIGALVAIVVAITLGQIDLWVPIVVGGVLQIALGVWLILVMPETGFTRVPPAERETWTALRTTARNGFGAIRRSRALMLLAVAAALAGAASEPFDRLWQAKYLKEVHFPTFGGWSDLTWFGILNVASLLLGIALSTFARRRVKEVTSERTLTRIVASLMALQVVGLVIFGLAGGFLFANDRLLPLLTQPIAATPLLQLVGHPDDRPRCPRDRSLGHGSGRRDRTGRRRPGDRRHRYGGVVAGRVAQRRRVQAPAVALIARGGCRASTQTLSQNSSRTAAPADGVLEHPPVTET